MRIFVTGGTGFVGKPLIELLRSDGHSLLILTRKVNKKGDKEFLEGDLSDIARWGRRLKAFKPDKAIHLAWEGLPDYGYQMSRKNFDYGLNLYEFLMQVGCKCIFTSGSGWEYGKEEGRLTESMPLVALNSFVAAKNALNVLGSELAKEKGIQFIWGRIFFSYGPSQRETSLIPRLINYSAGGEAPKISNPDTKLDFVFVDDVAQAILSLIKNDHISGTYNIGSGKMTSIGKIIKIIGEKTKKEFYFRKLLPNVKNTELSKRAGYYANISKIKKHSDWKPQTNIDVGIDKTISHYLKTII